MSACAAIIFAAFHFEHADFIAASVREHCGMHRIGGVEVKTFAVGNHQGAPQGHRFAFGGVEFFHLQFVTERNFVLLAAGFDYRIHGLFVWVGLIGLRRR